jgi:hypothetical protein
MKIRDLVTNESKLFLKSEYGPLSEGWPVVAFSATALKNKIEREYRTGRDFIVYTGTGGPQTEDMNDRSRLLSIVEIDTTRTYHTADVIPQSSWDWATSKYPGQWESAFRAIRGWDIPTRPWTGDVLPNSYPKMGRRPYRGMVLELEGSDREALLDTEVVLIPDIDVFRGDGALGMPELLRSENLLLNQEANRLADLVYSRVQLSGQVVQHTAPIRTAPTDLLLQIANLLHQSPLTCGLCGGVMTLRPKNKLLQPSGDRRDSSLGDYGPNNYQLVHLACNLGKNSASEEQFQEWLEVVRVATESNEAS